MNLLQRAPLPRPHHSLLLAVTLSLAMWGPVAPAVAGADQSSDIPGIPLAGTLSTGLLGGPVYDVVYRVTVPAGSILVADLSGTPGTDFDLYVFNSTATTVQSKAGLVASSTGPTSDEAASVPSRTGGTYYIDLNGASELQGNYVLTVQVVTDPTPPTAVVKLAGGKAATNQLVVPVEVTAQDDLSGIAQMAFSSDGISYTDWQPFQPSSTWTFPAGDGAKSLWVKVLNGVGLESAPAHASVTLDTVPPGVVSVQPGPSASDTRVSQVFSATFTEPVDPSTWSAYGLIVQDATGSLVKGGYSYDAASRTGAFTPSRPLTAGASYVVTIGQVSDLAGNRIAPIGSWIITPRLDSAVTLKAVPTVVQVGGSATLAVSAAGPTEGETLDLLERPATVVPSGPNDGFTPTATLVPLGGAVSTLVHPTTNTAYRVRYPGNPSTNPATADIRILVRRGVVLVGIAPTAVRNITVGTPVRLTTRVSPAASAVSVSFRLYRYDPARLGYVFVRSWGRSTDSAGQAVLAWTNGSRGSFYWRVTVSSTIDFANNTSPLYRWSVR